MTGRRVPGGRRGVLAATVTPLASIFGSGFLIIVPVLERILGPWSVLGAAAVCAVAWWAGSSVRHNVRVVEPLADAKRLGPTTRGLDRLADAVIVLAYVISVALYLRIMAQYIVGFIVAGGSPLAEKIIACSAVGLIMAIGLTHGFKGLDLLERVGLAAVLVLALILGAVLLGVDVRDWAGGDLRLPPVPQVGTWHILLVLGGIVITVQGFETIRYLGNEYAPEVRIRSSRVAQVLATLIYVGLVVVVTPLMGLGTPAGPDETLLQVTGRAAAFLTLPLVIGAVLSQFSAAVADTAAADGNLRRLSRWMHGPRPYLLSGILAIALAATVGTFGIVAIASRAFAAYYALQAVIAFRTSSGWPRKLSYATLAVVMAAITLLAQPVG